MKRFFLMLALLLAPSLVLAHSYELQNIKISHAWARATASSAKNGAVFIPLLNSGKVQDALIAASTPVAELVEIHETVKHGEIHKMEHQHDLQLVPNKPVAMRPGGKHLMLMGLKQQLKEDDKFPMTLEFAKAGKIEIEVWVHAAGATSGGH